MEEGILIEGLDNIGLALFGKKMHPNTVKKRLDEFGIPYFRATGSGRYFALREAVKRWAIKMCSL